MHLSHEIREAVIATVLQTLDASHPQAMSAAMLTTPLKLTGLVADITARDMSGLLHDLASRRGDNGQPEPWVEAVGSSAAAEVTRYRRTEAARVWLVSNGLL